MLKFSHVSFWRIENNIFRVKCAPSFHVISILSMNLETKNGTWIICIYIWRPTCPRLYLPSHPHQYFLIYQPWSNNFRWQCSSSCRSFWAVWPAGCGCSQQVADLWGYTIQGWGKRNVHLWYADTPVLSASSSVISTFIKMCFFIFLTSKRFSVAFLNAFLYFMVIFTVWNKYEEELKHWQRLVSAKCRCLGLNNVPGVVLIKIIKRLYATAMLCLPAMKLQTF